VPQQLRAVADGEAALSQLRARFILQSLRIAHDLGRRVGVDRRGRHGWRLSRCVGAGVVLLLMMDGPVSAVAGQPRSRADWRSRPHTQTCGVTFCLRMLGLHNTLYWTTVTQYVVDKALSIYILCVRRAPSAWGWFISELARRQPRIKS
jgi:hypothetical protein